MILFESSIIKLDYNPATDILDVSYPDLHAYFLSEIKNTIDIMIEMIKNYDVKKLILDSSKTVISVSEEESREMAAFLASGLMKTRIQKVARVQSTNVGVETTAQRNIRHIKESGALPFQVQNFNSKADAINWMKNSQ